MNKVGLAFQLSFLQSFLTLACDIFKFSVFFLKIILGIWLLKLSLQF